MMQSDAPLAGRPEPVSVPGSPPGRLSLPTRLALAVLAVVGVAFLFGMAMAAPPNYDEDQFLAAGLLTRTGLPYRDFVYLQPPLYPFVLAAAFKLSGGYYLLTARLLTFAFSLISSALLWRLLRRLDAGPWLGVLLMAACLGSPFLELPLSIARNDALPLALLLGGLSVQLWADERSGWGRAGAALLLGLAVEAKLNYAFGSLALGVYALGAPGRRLPPFVLGTLGAATPSALCAWAAPGPFRFDVFAYHLAGPQDWYGRQGFGDALLLPSRVWQLAVWLITGGNLALVLLCAGLGLVAMARRRKWKRPGPLLVGLLLPAFVLGFLPTPSWPMYYAATAPLLALSAAHLDRMARTLASQRRRRLLTAAAAIPAVLGLVPAGLTTLRALSPANWTGLQAHRTAVAVHDALHGRPGAVATLFPAAVMDANAILPTLASGPFVFRSGDRFAPALLVEVHALSPATLQAAFAAAPPAAIYARPYSYGWTTPMDGALNAYAQAHDWRLVHTDATGGRLWVPP